MSKALEQAAKNLSYILEDEIKNHNCDSDPFFSQKIDYNKIYRVLTVITQNPFVIESHAHLVATLIQKELCNSFGSDASIVLLGSNVYGTNFLRRELGISYKKSDFDFGIIGVNATSLYRSNFLNIASQIINDHNIRTCGHVNPTNYRIDKLSTTSDVAAAISNRFTNDMILNPTYPYNNWVANLRLLN